MYYMYYYSEMGARDPFPIPSWGRGLNIYGRLRTKSCPNTPDVFLPAPLFGARKIRRARESDCVLLSVKSLPRLGGACSGSPLVSCPDPASFNGGPVGLAGRPSASRRGGVWARD